MDLIVIEKGEVATHDEIAFLTANLVNVQRLGDAIDEMNNEKTSKAAKKADFR